MSTQLEVNAEMLANRLEVATTILQQLGGKRFQAMVGLKNAAAIDGGVTFRIGTGALQGINCVKVVLTAADDYTVTFGRVWGTSYKVIRERDGIYADGLVQVFEMATGFKARLF